MADASEISRAGAALERLSPGVRRAVVAASLLLALGAGLAALTTTSPGGGHKRSEPAAAASSSHPSLRRLPLPVSTAAMLQAGQVAARFLAGYLRFAYGRGSALAVSGVTPALRRQLLRQRATSSEARFISPPTPPACEWMAHG